MLRTHDLEQEVIQQVEGDQHGGVVGAVGSREGEVPPHVRGPLCLVERLHHQVGPHGALERRDRGRTKSRRGSAPKVAFSILTSFAGSKFPTATRIIRPEVTDFS